MKGNVSLKQIYICELYLMYGNSPYIKSGNHIPKSFQNIYKTEIDMEYDSVYKKYKADYDSLWTYFEKHYEQLLEKKRIRSFEQLVYEAMK